MAGWQGLQHPQESGGQALKNLDQQFTVDLAGQLEVLEIDKGNDATKIKVTASKAMKTENGATTGLVPAGSVIFVDKKSGKVHLEIEIGTLSKEASEALQVVLTAHQPESPNDDDVFGTRDQKKIGDSWPVNAVLGAEDLKKHQVIVDPKKFHGESTLAGVEKINSDECLKINAEVKIDAIEVPLPAGMRTSEGAMTMSATGLFPTNFKKPPARDSMAMSVHVVGVGKMGTGDQARDVSFTFDRKQSLTRSNSYE